jgi:hypothetical protein
MATADHIGIPGSLAPQAFRVRSRKKKAVDR